MSGGFTQAPFSVDDLNDEFFSPLRTDYGGQEFDAWFTRKARAGESALVYRDEFGIAAFVYLKGDESESLVTDQESFPSVPRMKIGTLRLAERVRGLRLGEGAIGVALWRWRDSGLAEIYTTVHSRHVQLVELLTKFGFHDRGGLATGERLMMRSKSSSGPGPFAVFPYLHWPFRAAGILPVEEEFHDRPFPYSELKGVDFERNVELDTAGNGVTKVFVAAPTTVPAYEVGMPVLTYRKSASDPKTYKSVVTGFATVVSVTWVKSGGQVRMSFDDFVGSVGNKTVYSAAEIQSTYGKASVVVIELLYNGYFGAGNNVSHYALKAAGIWKGGHPYQQSLTPTEFRQVLEMGKFNVQRVVVD